MRILFIGDVVGRPGREIVSHFLPEYRRRHEIDFVIANGENAANGKGLTGPVAADLFKSGVDVLTGGNHTWKNKDVYKVLEEDQRVLRPANYPPHPAVPGSGSALYPVPGTDAVIGVVNLLGRVFMAPVDCPFRTGKAIVEKLRKTTPLIVVDVHAEATSEKLALAWHLDGLVTAVIGTHTHVPTADERITSAGTAVQTDTGMTGPYDGVLGVRKDLILQTMIALMPVRHELAEGDLRLCGLLVEADPSTGRAKSVERICHCEP
jgi:2',3'-cyclic-nucleotide 2'-phosphodiesterase